MSPRTINNVLIRVPNWVGDAVMAVPALRELRRVFAGARITLAAKPWVSGLFDGETLADEILHLSDFRGVGASTRGFVSDARRLRRERFDLAVLLQNAFGAALLARAAGVREVAGYPTDGRRPLLDIVVPFDPGYRTAHQVSYYLKIVEDMERALTGESRVQLKAGRPRLHASEAQLYHSRRFLAGLGITAEGNGARAAVPPILALNPGATNSRAKRWPAARFAETADRLAEREGLQTIIVGSAGDVEVAADVAAQMRSPTVVLAGQTSIAELKGILACTSLVVSNDTGTAHVSAALGVPTVVVFGPTDHVTTRPLSEVATVVRREVECSPCMLRDCPIDHRCMTRVEVDEVCEAATRMLADSGE